jgi:hypothetical protein
MTTAVAKRSHEAEEMVAGVAKGRALMGGTEAMRKAGKTYLPKFTKESEDAYAVRLAASWLFNGYKKTAADMTGRVFAKSVELAGDAPSQVVAWCDNIDLQGRDLSTFARAVFEDAVSGPGVSYIMVDAPRRQEGVTIAQAQAQNLRPFFTHLEAESVLGWRSATVNNVRTLTQLRLMECVEEPDPADEFGTIEVDQVRVLDLIEGTVQVRLFRKADKDVDKWFLFDGPFAIGIDEITVVPFYANRDEFFTGEPLLADLADINIAHWQSQSDQRNILHFARVPILFGSGFEAGSAIEIGSQRAVMAPMPDAKLQWVEHSGAAIDAGRQDLKDLEFQMETFGLQLLVAKPAAQSATGEALDAAKETSTLSMTADALQDALEQALLWACKYAGIAASPSVLVNKDFGVHPMASQDILAMLQLVLNGVISQATFIEEMVRRGAIRADITPDEEYQRVLQDRLAGMADTQPGNEMLP